MPLFSMLSFGCHFTNFLNFYFKRHNAKCLILKHFNWSGQQDLNLRPHGPEPCALPNCAMPRLVYILSQIFIYINTVNEFYLLLFGRFL